MLWCSGLYALQMYNTQWDSCKLIISLMPDEGHKAKMLTPDQCLNPLGPVMATLQSPFGCSANLSRHEAG